MHSGVTVELTEKMSIDAALRKFKKKLIKEDVLNQYNEHTRYLKPSAKKHQKKVKADHIRKKILEAETIENAKMSKKKNETSIEER